MVFYKVGNQYLSEDAYNDHCVGNWTVMLFIIGALAAGWLVQGVIEDWPKMLRYIAVLGSGILAGSLLGMFAASVRKVLLIAISAGVLALLGYGIWVII